MSGELLTWLAGAMVGAASLFFGCGRAYAKFQFVFQSVTRDLARLEARVQRLEQKATSMPPDVRGELERLRKLLG